MIFNRGTVILDITIQTVEEHSLMSFVSISYSNSSFKQESIVDCR